MKELLIEPGRAERNYWRDLWRFRELFYFLAWRDILVRYKQTVIGIAWSLLRPIVTMVIFTFIFGNVAKLPSEGEAPYALMVAAGLLPWTFFSTALSEAAGSLVSNSNLISKVYFPRLVVPASSIVTSLVDFFISVGMFAVLMVWFKFAPDWRVLTLPLFTLLAAALAAGAGLLLAALTVKFRDFRFVVPFIVQFGLFISPVGYSSKTLPAGFEILYALNPMVGIIDGFRWALLHGQRPLDPAGLAVSAGVTAAMLVVGIWYFRKTEKTFADII
ncbi:MAG: ABC transporter permease [Verrucomicrobia bacterium]|nr:ABC transporter permease [Verrucomicrobiota bacterium]